MEKCCIYVSKYNIDNNDDYNNEGNYDDVLSYLCKNTSTHKNYQHTKNIPNIKQ